jgi:hypothetical protein
MFDVITGIEMFDVITGIEMFDVITVIENLYKDVWFRDFWCYFWCYNWYRDVW